MVENNHDIQGFVLSGCVKWQWSCSSLSSDSDWLHSNLSAAMQSEVEKNKKQKQKKLGWQDGIWICVPTVQRQVSQPLGYTPMPAQHALVETIELCCTSDCNTTCCEWEKMAGREGRREGKRRVKKEHRSWAAQKGPALALELLTREKEKPQVAQGGKKQTCTCSQLIAAWQWTSHPCCSSAVYFTGMASIFSIIFFFEFYSYK